MSRAAQTAKASAALAARREAARAIRIHADSVEELAPVHAAYLRDLPRRVWGLGDPHTTPSVAEVASWED